MTYTEETAECMQLFQSKAFKPLAVKPVDITTQNVQGKKNTRTASFEALGLDRWLCEIVDGLCLKLPTPVQRVCIPTLLSSRYKNLIGVAKTGSGKTAAFALPILHNLNRDLYGPHSLILTPTRELAVQIEEQVRVFGRDCGVKVALVVGGDSWVEQQLVLSRKPHIIIATPGRLSELLSSARGSIDLKRLKYLVLDEADRLLDCKGTFVNHELPNIFSCIKMADVSMMLFTATFTNDLEQSPLLPFMQPENTFKYIDNTEFGIPECIEQRYLFIPSKVKDCYLYYLLTNRFTESVLIFVGKCVTAELLCIALRQLGVSGGIVTLHSKQPHRTKSLASFRSSTARILIATDVASRGLDIPTVSVVINYDLPAAPQDYVHRVGRVGRGLRQNGLALSLVCELDIDLVQCIEQCVGKQMDELKGIGEDEVLESINKCSDARQFASLQLRDAGFGNK